MIIKARSGGWLQRNIFFPRNIVAGTCMNSQRLWLYEQDLYKLKTDKIPARRMGKRYKVSTLVKKLLAIDSC